MTVPGGALDSARQAEWEEAGRDVATSLDDASTAVVVGDDPAAAAAVALGIGRIQSLRRRVAIGDLVGEVPPLQTLVTGDDPHGLVDSFLYGVSLNRIARAVDSSGNLFILPSGSEPVVAEEIFRNERWTRLAIGFRDVGALMLLVAPARAPGLDVLARKTDGVVLVGRTVESPGNVPVLGVASIPTRAHVEPLVADVAWPGAAPIAPHLQPRAEPPAAFAAPVAPRPSPIPTPEPTPQPYPPPFPVPQPAPEPTPEPVPQPTPDWRREAEPVAEADATADAMEVTAETKPPARRGPATRWIRRIVEAPPTRVNVRAVGAPAPPEAPNADGAAAPAADAAAKRRPAPRPADRRATARPAPGQRPAWLYPVAAAVVVAAVGTVLITRSGGTRSESGRRTAPSRSASADSATGDSATVRNESAGTLATGASAAAAPAPAVAPPAPRRGPPVSNPADSAAATNFSVQIVAANTLEGARAKLRDVAVGLPAAIISPMALGADSTRWYRLTVGAFPDQRTAASFVANVAQRRKLDLDASNIVRLPYALLVDSAVPRPRVKARVAALAARGIPAYALLQPNGTIRVYAGAFETPEQATLLASQLRTAGVEPVIAYRTGRSF